MHLAKKWEASCLLDQHSATQWTWVLCPWVSCRMEMPESCHGTLLQWEIRSVTIHQPVLLLILSVMNHGSGGLNYLPERGQLLEGTCSPHQEVPLAPLVAASRRARDIVKAVKAQETVCITITVDTPYTHQQFQKGSVVSVGHMRSIHTFSPILLLHTGVPKGRERSDNIASGQSSSYKTL